MNPSASEEEIATSTDELSEVARRRMLRCRGEPLFFPRWDRAVFIHYEANPVTLQRDVPFRLDVWRGRAFVSLVAFTMQRMRPRRGGRLGEWFLKSIATHEFLNVRTYVRHQDEAGIYFLAEWLSNRLSVHIGPRTFGLPYRFARIDYTHIPTIGPLRGLVRGQDGQLSYEATTIDPSLAPCESGSLDEFLMERYTAFTRRGRRNRLFRVWHPSWSQQAIDVAIATNGLLGSTGRWWNTAEYIGGNYSPGVEVWMGRPHRIN